MKFISATIVLLLSVESFAKNNNIDSILDRLERKLMESKQDSFLLNDKWNKPIKKPTRNSYQYKKATIAPTLPSQGKLEEIGVAIDSIEREVNRLAADMERMKQVLGQKTSIDTKLEIKTEISNPQATIIRELVIEMDGFELFRLNPDSRIWTPKKVIPIYSGSVRPGQHNIQVKGRIARIMNEKLPIDDNTFNLIEGGHTITVPAQKYRKGLKIVISEPTDKNYTIKANIVEYSL